MKSLLVLILSMLLFSLESHAQLNVELLHQLVKHSKDEHERQSTARNRQAITSANEVVNRTKMEELKQKYSTLQSRFHMLGLAIDATQIGIQAVPLLSEIIEYQKNILQLAGNNPLLLAMAYHTEVDFADKAYMLSRYLYALAISIGDLNQMKASDRKLLFSHVLNELRLLAGAARGLLVNMSYARSKILMASINPFAGFINRDRELVNDILSKFRLIKQ